ncbi:MAG: hypothetical protein ACO398_04950 [Kiritimatiellia bacterium]
MLPDFQQFIAVDWSGARGPKLPGLQLAVCSPGHGAPRLLKPPRHLKTWTRVAVFERILEESRCNGPVLAGFDMSVAFPFCDLGCYFPGHPESPPNPPALWRTVDELSDHADDYYAGAFSRPGSPYADYLNAPGHRGAKYDVKRLRVTDQQCLNWTRPSSVFNGVGPGSVGTGSLAGMRFFNAVKQCNEPGIKIWPFDKVTSRDKLILCEIFPRFYVKRAHIDPRSWREKSFLNRVLQAYNGETLRSCPRSEDEIDALLSAAAMRNLAIEPATWRPASMSPQAASQEGWIFGVR